MVGIVLFGFPVPKAIIVVGIVLFGFPVPRAIIVVGIVLFAFPERSWRPSNGWIVIGRGSSLRSV